MFNIIKPFSNANIPRTIRFTEKLFEELNKTAEENDISFNMLVLQCCRYALDHLVQDSEKQVMISDKPPSVREVARRARRREFFSLCL